MPEHNPPASPEPTPRGIGAMCKRIVVGAVNRPMLSLCLLALLGSAGVIAWGWLRDPGINSPGPLVLAHERLECSACHTTGWRPLKNILAKDRKEAYLELDKACVECH